jgi:hypothetical protein
MDPDSDTQIQTQRDKTNPLSRYVAYVSDVLSPIWVRCCTIFFNIDNRKYLESQYYYVFHIGSIFYFLFFIAKTYK